MNGFEYKKFFDNIDNMHDVVVFIDQVRLNLTKFEYLLLMKVLFNNVLYDDGCD